jgi:hypothetical protein
LVSTATWRRPWLTQALQVLEIWGVKGEALDSFGPWGLTDVSPLAELPQLRSLALARCPLDDSLSSLSALQVNGNPQHPSFP